jgi:hypothetical protein
MYKLKDKYGIEINGKEAPYTFSIYKYVYKNIATFRANNFLIGLVKSRLIIYSDHLKDKFVRR